MMCLITDPMTCLRTVSDDVSDDVSYDLSDMVSDDASNDLSVGGILKCVKTGVRCLRVIGLRICSIAMTIRPREKMDTSVIPKKSLY